MVTLLGLTGWFILDAGAAERSRLVDGPWKFQKGDAAVDASTGTWATVEIPHTWNAEDGADGGGNYYRGPVSYAKELELPSDAVAGKRVFIRFEAASIVSDVYFNGQHLGQHRGAFGAFCYELTTLIHPDGSPNDLRVRVDNTRVEDVAPLGGDFTVCGGIYRPVSLLILPTTCISPLDDASPGVYIRQRDVSEESAKVEIRTIYLDTPESRPLTQARVTVRDAGDNTVAQSDTQAVGTGGSRCVLTLDKPHLWNGVADPYLYTVESSLLDEKGETIDAVVQPLGLRAVSIEPQKGFILNGQSGKVRGVDRHQDRLGKGWAVSDADRDEDMAIMKEMGVTGVRLAHYPHDDYFYGLCDREGIIAWAEIPLVNHIKNTPAFRDNIKSQLRELIRQQGNHPSICFWSLFNELYVPPTDRDTVLVRELHDLARAEDSTRGTVFAGHGEAVLKKPELGTPEDLRNITDYVAFNRYPGWYQGDAPQMAQEIEGWNRSGRNRGVGISEYGAGANPSQHEPWPPSKPANTTGPVHTEEYQASVHEQTYRAIASSPVTWGSFVWAMFDFASDNRKEGGQAGINDKGLVTGDRKTRKDAFYFYKANWNPDPCVHIVGGKATDHPAGPTSVRVYSNCEQVELLVNGKSLGTKAPDAFKCLLWESVDLQTGTNHLEATAVPGTTSGEVLDACDWTGTK